MISQDVFKTLPPETLGELIDWIDQTEKDFNSLKSLFKFMVEVLPNPLWIFDKNGEVFLQNNDSLAIGGLVGEIDFGKKESEVEYAHKIYLVKIYQDENYQIITAFDITEHKRKERLLHMGQVAAHLAHEIRNPIGAVANLAHLLLKKVDEKSKPIVEEMKKSIWRVEKIIHTTLMFSKGVVANKRLFNHLELKEDILLVVSNYTYAKEIRFEFENFEPKEIWIDFDLISLLFQNMIFNAIDAIEEGDEETGVVRIVFDELASGYQYTIYDSGVAIKNKEKIFEAFETTKTKGNGLGLSLVKQIVDAHGGEIKMFDTPKRFVITLIK